MTDKGRNILKIVLTCIIALTVTSFFVHSLMPRSVSSAESEGVASILSTIIPVDTPIGGFIINNVRKIAHFCEYGALGIELWLVLPTKHAVFRAGGLVIGKKLDAHERFCV